MHDCRSEAEPKGNASGCLSLLRKSFRHQVAQDVRALSLRTVRLRLSLVLAKTVPALSRQECSA